MRSNIWSGACSALFAFAIVLGASLVTSGAVADGGEGFIRSSGIKVPYSAGEVYYRGASDEGYRKGLALRDFDQTGEYSPEQEETDKRNMELRRADPAYDENYRKGVTRGFNFGGGGN